MFKLSVKKKNNQFESLMVVIESFKEQKNKVSGSPEVGGHGMKHSCGCDRALVQVEGGSLDAVVG